MSQSVVPATGEERKVAQDQSAKDAEQNAPKQLDALHTEQGDTTIADSVVAKIAGIAAREVPGVFAMGNVARRVIGSIAQRVSGGSAQQNVTNGVSIEKGEYETAVEVSVVIAYGESIPDVSQRIRENVIQAVEYGTGLHVVSVDVEVSDVHLPEDDDDPSAASSTSADDLR